MSGLNTIETQIYHAPCGDLILGAFDGKLCLCDWTDGLKRDATDRKLRKMLHAEYKESDSVTIDLTVRELDEFFAGHRISFDIPLLFIGTEFQKQVWDELTRIPYGTVISYGELARHIGYPTAVRAVANANARNPISILVPCHRVIGSNHKFTGYGGGLPAKRFLLELETGNTVSL